MKRYVKQKYQKPGEVYLGCVHRLDRPVGGLVALARTSKAASRLSEQLRSHAMRREYLAVVSGEIAEAGELRDWLLKGDTVTVVPRGTPEAQEAVLRWRRLDVVGGDALVLVQLETGRKHQIRVQLAHAGHPIKQDLRYGQGKPGEPIALWGAMLTLEHPTRRERMMFVSPPRGKAFAPFADTIDRLLHAAQSPEKESTDESEFQV